MKILWLSWKDSSNPRAGGAEVVGGELAKRLVQAGNEVIFIVAGFKGAAAQETHADGYKIIRLGNRYTVYHKAHYYYRDHLRGWPDLIIDEVNTIPFLAKFYAKEPVILLVHMLCRQIWFYESPFPFSTIGYLLEPLYLRTLNNLKVITVSNSTSRDLQRRGFNKNKIHIISEGVSLPPLNQLPPITSKYDKPTMLSLGAQRPMKRTLDQIKAFTLAKQQLPDLQLHVAGASQGRYGKRVAKAIAKNPYKTDITYHGQVTTTQKIELMQRCHLIAVTSIKEGWGLIVSEANSQGTPAVVYNVDGLRDSVRQDVTGLITERNTPQQLATSIVTLLSNQKQYAQYRQAAWEWSQNINFDESYVDFIQAIVL